MRKVSSRMLIVCAGLVFGNILAAQVPVASVKRPLAMDRIQKPPSDLFVLTSSQVLAFRDDGGNLEVAGSFTLPASESPSDLVTAFINKQLQILVSGLNPFSGGFLTLFTSTGQIVRSWTSSHPLCGIDFDGGQVIYIASCDSNEIYYANINIAGQIPFLAELPGARHLGPVIVDNSRNRLLVGEIDSGEIYTLELKGHSSRLFARGFGTPQAFSFSPDLQQLVVADSSRRMVYRVDLNATLPSPIPYSPTSYLQEPVGVALLAGGRVAVADDRTNAIFVLPFANQPKGTPQVFTDIPVANSPNDQNGTAIASILDRVTLHEEIPQLLSSSVFGKRVCVVKGHFRDAAFHIYVFASSNPISSCPNHDSIRAVRKQSGNQYWSAHGTGEIGEFEFPAQSGHKYAIAVEEVDESKNIVRLIISARK